MNKDFKLPTLYKESKNGKIRQWSIWTEDDKVWTEHGQKGGKLQQSYSVAEAKNVGKSNETTPQEQAKKEAKSKWQKKLDKKYYKTVKEAKELDIFPMLAKTFKAEKIKYPCDIQAKFDGMRAMAFMEDGEIKFKSRGGKYYENLEHLAKQLEPLFKEDDKVIFDGEIYKHGATFQECTRLVKKYRPDETEELCYYVYDCVYPDKADKTWVERKSDLLKFMNMMMQTRNLLHVNSLTVENDLELQSMHERFVEEGYEGSIVRLHFYPYEFGHRSSGLFKVKDFDDEEFKIIGYDEGKGRLRGCVLWVCDVGDGNTIQVSPKGSLEQRQQWLQEAEKHVGKWLKVKYFGKSEDGIPRFPVGVGIRMEKDMD